jgi:predicted nuclease of predicted toxin-antitoxin system
VKFLIDNNLSPLLADALKAAGHDAVHLRDLGMQAATDHIVLEHARALDQVAEDLTAGAIVVLHEDSLRVRRLPMPG